MTTCLHSFKEIEKSARECLHFQIFVQSKMGLIWLQLLLMTSTSLLSRNVKAMSSPSQGAYLGNVLPLSSHQDKTPVQNLLNNADRPLVRTKKK